MSFFLGFVVHCDQCRDAVDSVVIVCCSSDPSLAVLRSPTAASELLNLAFASSFVKTCILTCLLTCLCQFDLGACDGRPQALVRAALQALEAVLARHGLESYPSVSPTS